MLISKLIYYDENNIFLGAHQVKIIGYSLLRLESMLLFMKKKKLITKLTHSYVPC
jgi:hypothetical protein